MRNLSNVNCPHVSLVIWCCGGICWWLVCGLCVFVDCVLLFVVGLCVDIVGGFWCWYELWLVVVCIFSVNAEAVPATNCAVYICPME